ncbi:MAG: TIGR03546 family protein [Gammaproteobacteria bacterium]|nr:TIGR03546 family protein [Gammaproteobacteria bacterium]MDH5653862.1 TIGR03546 family protein [Gammaproteobacteria bacterium]
MLDPLLKLIKALNSETEPGQMSLALAFSMIAGFTPFFSVHNILILFLVLILRVNFSAYLAGLAMFSVLAFALDPWFHKLGHFVLTMDSLKGMWTTMYNTTLWRVENFSNTIVMGSLLVSLLLFIPVHLLGKWLINRYRDTVVVFISKTRAVKFLKATKIYSLYDRVSG